MNLLIAASVLILVKMVIQMNLMILLNIAKPVILVNLVVPVDMVILVIQVNLVSLMNMT